MDAELREYLDSMRRELLGVVREGDERFGKRLEETEKRFENLVGETESRVINEMRTLRADMTQMEQRLTENIQGRREDIDAAFGDIKSLRRAVRDLDKR